MSQVKESGCLKNREKDGVITMHGFYCNNRFGLCQETARSESTIKYA